MPPACGRRRRSGPSSRRGPASRAGAQAAAKAAADAEAETRRALQRKETQKLIGLVADFAGVVRGRALRNAREALLVLEGPDHEDD
mmetsp:Transcript_50236/g.114016  ORF Transcript_50236/g.114016 Transcript_50236/m.114016 type:complete len:86 (+) Transcript_50236:163-420(+)